ncbi:MAG: hypothetical protein WDO24_12185 [Pseudomonadota bacterium]
MTGDRYALTLSCSNRPGIVAAVARTLFEKGADIHEAHQFDDMETGIFFARIAFNFVAEVRIDEFQSAFREVAETYEMTWRIRSLAERQRVLLLASRLDHCLVDLLYRWRLGELAMDVAGIVSNYPRETYQHHDFSDCQFDYLPIKPETKPQQEAEIWRIIVERRVDLVILARYMQIPLG